MAKLGEKQFGPFKVIEKVRHSSYKLELPKTWKNLHPIFNELLLTPYHVPKFPTQPCNTCPPPEIIGKELEYKVNKVASSRMLKRKFQHKVQCKGYSPHEQTWESPSNLKNAKEAVEDFHKQKGETRTHYSMKD